jgi:hypothetical protein
MTGTGIRTGDMSVCGNRRAWIVSIGSTKALAAVMPSFCATSRRRQIAENAYQLIANRRKWV